MEHCNGHFSDGAKAMRDQIAAWHDKLGYDFASLAIKLERDKAQDDAMKARWASSSHHAHAAAIRRMQITGK